MGRIFCVILIFAGLTLLSACNNPQPEAPELLEEAEQLIEVYPDSAMLLIDSLFYPEKSLSHEDYMRFLIRRVQAKYKINRPIHDDTLVFKAREYFSNRNKNPQLTTLAYFYSGCVYRERKEYKEAMQQYIEAEKYASEANNINLKGLVQYNTGDLLASQGLYLKAIDHYKNAERFYAESPEELYEKQVTSLSAIGRMFLLSGKNDSAFQYFHKGLQIAESKNDTKLQSLLSQNLSIAYRENKQLEEAEIYLRQSFHLNPDSIEISRYYLNLAQLYANQRKPDSVTLYTNKLYQSISSIDNNSLKASAYEFLASVEKENGNYEVAFDYNRKYTNVLIEIMNERSRQSIYEVQQKYNFELQQKQFDDRFTKAERFITVLIIIILMGALTFSLYTFKQRKKHILALQKINVLRNMADDLKRLHSIYESDTDRKIRSLMMDKFDTVKKVALLNNSINENDSTKKVLGKLNEIVYGENFEEEWLAISRVFNDINPGVSDVIQQRYPKLTRNEFRVFILSYAKFSPKEIAVVLNLTYDTVLTLRSSIRKKIKMNGSGLDDLLYL
ncbi:Tetratricopeptide repeat-containing protein [Porphyromonadaceae bacterium KH3R12]|nr:Tetratricopeptide repeat-containing protein [Porphyromonadaceae bacterium KH3R12]